MKVPMAISETISKSIKQIKEAASYIIPKVSNYMTSTDGQEGNQLTIAE